VKVTAKLSSWVVAWGRNWILSNTRLEPRSVSSPLLKRLPLSLVLAWRWSLRVCLYFFGLRPVARNLPGTGQRRLQHVTVRLQRFLTTLIDAFRSSLSICSHLGRIKLRRIYLRNCFKNRLVAFYNKGDIAKIYSHQPQTFWHFYLPQNGSKTTAPNYYSRKAYNVKCNLSQRSHGISTNHLVETLLRSNHNEMSNKFNFNSNFS